MGQAILVFGIGVGDVGLAFLQFGLAELDDGAKTKIVAGLRKLQGQSGLLPQLPGDGKALIGAAGILPGSAHITGGKDGDRSQGCTGPRGRTLREGQARPV